MDDVSHLLLTISYEKHTQLEERGTAKYVPRRKEACGAAPPGQRDTSLYGTQLTKFGGARGIRCTGSLKRLGS